MISGGEVDRITSGEPLQCWRWRALNELASENLDGRYPRSALHEVSDLKLVSVRFTESSRKEMVVLERLSRSEPSLTVDPARDRRAPHLAIG